MYLLLIMLLVGETQQRRRGWHTSSVEKIQVYARSQVPSLTALVNQGVLVAATSLPACFTSCQRLELSV